jgi:hypothetical protein
VATPSNAKANTGITASKPLSHTVRTPWPTRQPGSTFVHTIDLMPLPFMPSINKASDLLILIQWRVAPG